MDSQNSLTSVVLCTTYASIVVQVLTGLVGAYGLVTVVPPEHRALQTSLQIEMAMQAIELGFYFWIVEHFDVATMGATRYRDWIFTTPLMLFSLMLYFKYEEQLGKGHDTTALTWQRFLQDNKAAVAAVLVGNTLMLVSGYLGEVGTIPKPVATFAGFAAFAYTFHTAYIHFASTTVVGSRLLQVIAAVWGLYGVASVLPAAHKNIAYNGLDVVAKNLFGVYLAHKILSRTQ